MNFEEKMNDNRSDTNRTFCVILHEAECEWDAN